jgi:NADPH-dependent 2,4-dienoyl-CoA reductase/sulfur reductase-like enzyme
MGMERDKMAEKQSYLIIGNGIAGVTAAEVLRNEDAAAEITVVADDPFPVYYRPALKDYLGGKIREDKLWARPISFYQNRRIGFLHDRVVGIQVGRHCVQLRSGKTIGYSRLLLAHGARSRTLTCSGSDLTGVSSLRTVADYQKVLQRLNSVRRVVVVGGGTLALESIETLRHRGFQVTHLLHRRALWSDVLDATASDLVLQQEKHDGVDIRYEQEVLEIVGRNGQVSGVITTSGAHIPCEMVLAGIGIEPNIDFVQSAGIACGRGVKVDAAMRTNAPDIYAAGDLIEITDPLTGRTRLPGQWYPSIQQARAAAYSMLDLLDARQPLRFGNFYNATFLYGLDFASVGITTVPQKGYQEVVADPQARIYQKAVLKDGIVVGMLALGDRKHVLTFKRAIDAAVDLSPVASRLFAPDFKLSEWLDKQGVPGLTLGISREGTVAVKKAAYAGVETRPAQIRQVDESTSVLLRKSELEEPLAHTQPIGPGGSPATSIAVPKNTPTLIALLPGKPEVFSLERGKRCVLGRDKGSQVVLDDMSVSRKHAEIVADMDGFYVHDLASSNGIQVNHTRISSPYRLSDGDTITIGNVSLYFVDWSDRINPVGQTLDKQEATIPPLSKDCPRCGAKSNSMARFCPRCGIPL